MNSHRSYLLFTEVTHHTPVGFRDCEPFAVSWSDVDVDSTEVVVFLVTWETNANLRLVISWGIVGFASHTSPHKNLLWFFLHYFPPIQKKKPPHKWLLLCVGVRNHLVFCCQGLSCTAEPCSSPGWCGPHGWAGFQQTRLERRPAVYSAPAAAASTWWRERAKLRISLPSASRRNGWQQYSLPFIGDVNVGAKFDVL